MPRRRNTKESTASTDGESLGGNELSANQTAMSLRVSGEDVKLYTRKNLEQSMVDKLAEIDAKGRQSLKDIQEIHATLRLNLKENQLKTVISLVSLLLHEFVFTFYCFHWRGVAKILRDKS